MLTITTNKERIKGIVKGDIKEHALPITDFWTKRIVKLLGFGEADERTIMSNLEHGRPGTTDAEREVSFTAGGAVSCAAMVTVKIAVLEQEKLSGGSEGVDHFILTIRSVSDVRGIDDADPEEEDGQEVVGMPNAPAVRIMKSQSGFCKYCNQLRMIEAPEGASPADLNEQASDECDCDEAVRQRERRAKMEAAGAWAENVFSKENGQLQTVLCAIRSTFAGSIDYVTVKVGKYTHKIDTDSDGMIRIRTTYRDSNEETF